MNEWMNDDEQKLKEYISLWFIKRKVLLEHFKNGENICMKIQCDTSNLAAVKASNICGRSPEMKSTIRLYTYRGKDES